MNNRLVAVTATVLCALALACAKPPAQDPDPKPDHGPGQQSKACPRADLNTVCVEFYSDEAVTLHVRVTGLNGDGESAPLVDQRIKVEPGGGAVGFSLPLDIPPVAIGGRATAPKGILIGCRILVRGLEIPDVGRFEDNGSVVCLFTTS